MRAAFGLLAAGWGLSLVVMVPNKGMPVSAAALRHAPRGQRALHGCPAPGLRQQLHPSRRDRRGRSFAWSGDGRKIGFLGGAVDLDEAVGMMGALGHVSTSTDSLR